MNVIIMRGLPGSGKDYWIKHNLKNPKVCSADDFFTHNSEYIFDHSRLPEAHGTCLLAFIEAVEDGIKYEFNGSLVVNNTNVSALQMAPYVAIAMAYDIAVRIVTIVAPVNICADRNVHGVLPEIVGRIASRFEFYLPPFWPQQEVVHVW